MKSTATKVSTVADALRWAGPPGIGSRVRLQFSDAVTGASDTPSSLDTVNPGSGATTLISGPDRPSDVTGIDLDPTTGILDGVVSGMFPVSGGMPDQDRPLYRGRHADRFDGYRDP